MPTGREKSLGFVRNSKNIMNHKQNSAMTVISRKPKIASSQARNIFTHSISQSRFSSLEKAVCKSRLTANVLICLVTITTVTFVSRQIS